MIVDRESRDLLAESICRYLNDELTAFEFDEANFRIAERTADGTVRRVVEVLWHYYDDCDDHHVVLDRAGWNYFQRLRLLLKSDATLEVSTKRLWSSTQVVAAAALAGFAWCAAKTGVGEHLWLAAIALGVASIGLSRRRGQLYRRAMDWDVTLYPFTSLGQLLWVGREAADFRKEKYPPHLESRRIRDAASERIGRWQMYLHWLMYSPVVLLAQVFPPSIRVHRVRCSATS